VLSKKAENYDICAIDEKGKTFKTGIAVNKRKKKYDFPTCLNMEHVTATGETFSRFFHFCHNLAVNKYIIAN
jgi:hypothetical protein